MRIRKLALAALALVPSIALLSGCGGDEDPVEDAAEAVEDAAEEVGD